MIKTSARNQLECKVTAVNDGAINDSVELLTQGGQKLVATITRESTRYLELAPGKDAIALIKASSVIVALPDPGMKLSARNLLAGTVGYLTPGAVNAEVGIKLDGGVTLTAIITLESAHSLGLKQHTHVIAVIKSSMVILGTVA